MAGGVNPFGFSGGVIPQAVRPPKRGPQDLPSAPFGFAPPPSKWEQTKDILAPYVTGPWNAMTGLMDTPLHVLLGGGTQEQQEQAVANSFNTAGSFAGASSVVTKPRNALNMGFRVFHGSPHDFPPVRLIEMPDGQRLYQNMGELADTPQGAKIIQEYPMGRFDLSKIGTGEGAQAYGHGLYFAGHEPVAKGYRDALSEGVTFQGKRSHENDGSPEWYAANHVMELMRAGLSPEQAMAETRNRFLNSANEIDLENGSVAVRAANVQRYRMQNAISEAVDELSPADFSNNPGKMYEVEINADPDAFLDWDKPLSEQPEAVRTALKKLDIATGSMSAKDRVETLEAAMAGDPRLSHLLKRDSINITGDTVYRGMSDSLGATDWPVTADSATRAQYRSKGATNASQALREAGIPGIKYLDAGSRGAGDGTRNYVVFDDKLVSIVKKYGIAGASAMLGYNILDGMDPAQAEELQRIEGNQ
jgi:hypothetical protein